MKGLAVGEQSSVSRPILQLFSRSAGYLADIDSGSFIIEDISGTTPSTVVSTTNLTATEKLATGRYAITTGDTSAWDPGSHRVVVTYTLESGGVEYTQVIPFEVLTAVDWPTGMAYTGYLSSKLAQDDGYLASTVTMAKVHRLLDQASKQVEHWTHRFFEPRYLEVRHNGQNDPTLLFDHAIIALEDVWAIWESTTSTEDSYKYEQYLYKVFNRHLDGFLGEDDRDHPRIELVSIDGTIVQPEDYTWPFGTHNLLTKGVFGFTNPYVDPTGGRTGVGLTPHDIGVAVGALTIGTTPTPP